MGLKIHFVRLYEQCQRHASLIRGVTNILPNQEGKSERKT